ncbi:hypothetical protein [Paenibacillus sp. FSL K6-2859]|uniref:hypothetical protein n=1 Tax=Paenibacillus sp. FSL K6-2859 TaxID=2921482 RepID=UPI0030F986AC
MLINYSIKKAATVLAVACLFDVGSCVSTSRAITVTTSISLNMLIGQVPNF